MDTLILSEKKDRFEICAEVNIIGNDLLVILYGGVDHIGAVGMAQPRPSLRDPKNSAATSSVFTYIGHKEDIVVKAVSEMLAKNLNKRVVVVAGIHWDNLKGEEIEIIGQICDVLANKVITEVQRALAK